MKHLARDRMYIDMDELEPRMTLQMLMPEGSRELMPEEQLAAAVIRRAYADLKAKDGSWHSEALAFFCGHRNGLVGWCQVLGLDPRVVSELALGRDER